MTNRRSFLTVLAGAMVIDPEKLLWRPGAKLISIPAPQPSPMRLGELWQVYSKQPFFVAGMPIYIDHEGVYQLRGNEIVLISRSLWSARAIR